MFDVDSNGDDPKSCGSKSFRFIHRDASQWRKCMNECGGEWKERRRQPDRESEEEEDDDGFWMVIRQWFSISFDTFQMMICLCFHARNKE